MSDEPSSSAAQARPSNVAEQSSLNESSNHGSLRSSPQALRERRQRNGRLFNKKREALLSDLIRSIDLLIYTQLSTIYYLDTSFFRLLIRALLHFIHLTPKPASIPAPPARARPFPAILFSLILCLAAHLYFGPATATEATRGYLHGGLAMDLIGQRAPGSVWGIVGLDLLVFALQVVMLGLEGLRVRAKGLADGTGTGARQTVEDEEAGRVAGEEDGVELGELNADGTARGARNDGDEDRDAARDDEENVGSGEQSALLGPMMKPRSDAHIFDAFNSGEVVVADLDLVAVLRQAFASLREAPPPIDPAVRASSNPLAAALSWRVRVGNRTFGV